MNKTILKGIMRKLTWLDMCSDALVLWNKHFFKKKSVHDFFTLTILFITFAKCFTNTCNEAPLINKCTFETNARPEFV